VQKIAAQLLRNASNRQRIATGGGTGTIHRSHSERHASQFAASLVEPKLSGLQLIAGVPESCWWAQHFGSNDQNQSL